MGGVKIPADLQLWITARKRYKLSHAHVQMARELGMNPGKLGKLDNHKQERWKAPLPEFVQMCYERRFGRALPERIRSIEEVASANAEKKALRRERRAALSSRPRLNSPGNQSESHESKLEAGTGSN